MPASYTDDLRWRIVWHHLFLNIPADEVARLMFVSERTVYRYAERYCNTGEVKPFIKQKGPSAILCDHDLHIVLHFLLTQPGTYLHKLQKQVFDSTGTWVHVSTICRAVHHIGMTHLSCKRSEVKRAEFWSEVCIFDSSMFLWIDETGFDNRNLLRKYGYGLRGQPPQDHTLMLRGKHYSAIAVLSSERVEDVDITDDSVNGDVFLNFVHRCVLPI